MDLGILGWPDSSFGFFCNISGKTRMNFLGQTNRITKSLSHQNIKNDSLLSNTYSHISNNYLIFCSLIVQTLRSISWVSFNPWVLPLFLILFIENYLWKKLSYLTYNVSQRWKLDWLHPYVCHSTCLSILHSAFILVTGFRSLVTFSFFLPKQNYFICSTIRRHLTSACLLLMKAKLYE